MPKTFEELLVGQGGVRLPAVTSGVVLTDSSGNLIAQARQSVAFTTASLALNASENDNVGAYKTCKAVKIVTSRAARVRVYGTSAYRTADATRAATTDPTGDHGCLLEVVTSATMLSLTLAPPATLQNMDAVEAATLYFAVTNLGSTGAVTVTLTVLQEE